MLGRRTAPHFGVTAFRYAASHGRTSNVWKKSSAFFQPLERILPTSGKNLLDFFQCPEPQAENLPTTGRNPSDFSNAWTRAPIFFQGSDEKLRFFPTFGTLCDSARLILPMIGTQTTFPSNLRNADYVFFQPSDGPRCGVPLSGLSAPWGGGARNGRGWGAVFDVSTDWNDGVISVSECFTFWFPPRGTPLPGASRALRAPCFPLFYQWPETV
jgi:hypothetical protein